MFFIGFPILAYAIWPQAATSIGYTKPIKSVIKLYTDHDTLFVKHGTHQKAESLRAASVSNLDNMVNSSSTFNTKYSEFYTKW